MQLANSSEKLMNLDKNDFSLEKEKEKSNYNDHGEFAW